MLECTLCHKKFSDAYYEKRSNCCPYCGNPVVKEVGDIEISDFKYNPEYEKIIKKRIRR